MAAQEQARCLRGLEQANSVTTAARTSILGAFAAGKGTRPTPDYSLRALAHPQDRRHQRRRCSPTPHGSGGPRRIPWSLVELAAGEITESVSRTLCLWTDKLRQDRREEADKILTDAAVSGLGLADLAGLAAEMYERSRAEEPDRDKEESFEDRALRLVTTLGGAGVLHGDLTPECAAAVQAVLDALSAAARTRRTPAARSSGATTRSRKQCAGWRRRAWCRSGPGSR